MKTGIRDFFREMLELMFQAAALVIDTIRTFFLVVLAMLGPFAIGLCIMFFPTVVLGTVTTLPGYDLIRVFT